MKTRLNFSPEPAAAALLASRLEGRFAAPRFRRRPVPGGRGSAWRSQ